MLDCERVVFVVIYVDDLIILASLICSMKALQIILKEYEMTNIGKLHICLGVEFVRDRASRTVTMSEGKCVMDVLKQFGIKDCKPINTPLGVNCKLVKLTKECALEV